MARKAAGPTFPLLILLFFYFCCRAKAHNVSRGWPVVTRDRREQIVSTEYGEISAVQISDEGRGIYHLQFLTLEPNALFLPVLLHADMVFYVHTGSGTLTWADENKSRRVNLQAGDVYRVQLGTVFFLQSNLEPERQKLRIYAIFTNSVENLYEPFVGTYSSVHDMVLGFDKTTLQNAFKVPEEVIEEIARAMPPALVHAPTTQGRTFLDMEVQFVGALLGSKARSLFDLNKKQKGETFNIRKAKPDFKNMNGWSTTITRKNLPALKGSDMGLFMVNLTEGSMMGPHWNPMASEISIVVHGQGMVRVVCSGKVNGSECKNMRFKVKEGDVFVVPRFHPMFQMSFNNDSLVFMGFSTAAKKNHPQFLAGKASVYHALDNEVVAASFNVSNSTISQLFGSQSESIILNCTCCAEEEERKMQEEIEKEKEEAREREEEEARRREEEKRRKEEEERRREEEEAKREEERRRKEEEEAKKREEEEARRREEEEARRREEEEARRREEEAAEREEERREEEKEAKKKEKEEEEEARRRGEEEEARRREEEEARRREEEEEEEAEKREEERRRQEEEEEEARRREEEEARRREEGKERKEEEARRKEERRRKEEEEEARTEEEQRRKEEKEARKWKEEEETRQEEQARKREEEEEAGRREEEEVRRKEQEEARAREEERAEREEGEEAKKQEETEAKEA